MNRREFTRGLAALGAAPALPAQAVGAGAVAATATADKMYFVSWYTARLNKTCSPETLMSELNMQADVAHQVFGKLVQTNTVSAPDIFGVGRTLDPLSDSYLGAKSVVARQTATAKPASPEGRNWAKHLEIEDSTDDQTGAAPVVVDEVSDDPEEASEGSEDVTLAASNPAPQDQKHKT